MLQQRIKRAENRQKWLMNYIYGYVAADLMFADEVRQVSIASKISKSIRINSAMLKLLKSL